MQDNLLVITLRTKNCEKFFTQFFDGIKSSACRILESRTVVIGAQGAVAFFVLQGSWNALAKMQNTLARLKADPWYDWIEYHQEEEKTKQSELVIYDIDLVTAEGSKIVTELFNFFSSQNIVIQESSFSSYQPTKNSAVMLYINLRVGVPVCTSVTAFRADILDLCERLNMDAAIDAVK